MRTMCIHKWASISCLGLLFFAGCKTCVDNHVENRGDGNQLFIGVGGTTNSAGQPATQIIGPSQIKTTSNVLPPSGPPTPAEPDVFKRKDLLTVLALLVALSAYVANIRRDLVTKKEKNLETAREKMISFESESTAQNEKIILSQMILEKEEANKRIKAEQRRITCADILLIPPVILIGICVFWNEFFDSKPSSLLQLFGMLLTIIAIGYLISMHAVQWRKRRNKQPGLWDEWRNRMRQKQ